MSDENVVGIFMGLESSSNEYIAWLIAPYRPDFAIEIGNLLLIQNVRDSIVARVMDYAPRGEFVSPMGEKWLSEIASQGAIDEVGLDIKRSKISYRVRIKVLGSLSRSGFSPGLRRIPQITSKVRLPDGEELGRIITRAMAEQSDGVDIGGYDLDPGIPIRFDQRELNSKRTFVFARAGYGKSNLMKVICSRWRRENGGLLIFDPEGEYAITDRKGRPGVMDRRSAILMTNQRIPKEIGNVYPRISLNLAELPHEMIIPLLVNPAKHEMVFFAKLMAMGSESWPKLVDLLYREGWGADYGRVAEIVTGDAGAARGQGEVDIKPILNNLVMPIKKIHDPHSRMVAIIERAMRRGEVVIFDISRIDVQAARFVSSIIVMKIFNENKRNFIRQGGASLIRATFVLEEAHTVLSAAPSSPSAFVELAKEGRKYGLGGIFITQQPGSIPAEIISQGDNFFVFHLLSRTDLRSLSDANAHYSSDIITQILNEPIRGKSYMWTSHQPFVIPVRVANFEDPAFARPNQSVYMQRNDRILDEIRKEMRDEVEDPRYKAIYEKFLRVEKSGKDEKAKTVDLYRMLTEGEREYLMERNQIQEGYNGPFAVTFPFYRRLALESGDPAS